MKLIELTCRLNGYIKIFVNLNSGDGEKPHEIGIFSINEVPQSLNQRSVFYTIAKGDVLNVVISKSDNIEPGERYAHPQKEEAMIKMYIEFNNGGSCLLLTNGSKWMYLDETEIVPDISEKETAAENIRNAIENGDLYGAEDLWEECFDDEHHVSEYDGLTLDEIDKAVNYEDGMPKGHDYATWEEI